MNILLSFSYNLVRFFLSHYLIIHNVSPRDEVNVCVCVCVLAYHLSHRHTFSMAFCVIFLTRSACVSADLRVCVCMNVYL